jgi:alkylated DNA repair dioxygenase AlkB
MERRELGFGAFVEHEPTWLDEDEASRLQAALVQGLAWEQREIVLFGRRILQPRLIAWAGEVAYRYSGQTLERRAAIPALRQVQARVARRVGVPFNHVLVNRYRDGTDSMGMHADDEPELGDAPVVASVSLGATRRFVLVPRRGKGPGAADRAHPPAPGATARLDTLLGHGSLLVMGGTCQEHYRHGIPKAPAAHGERISLTFRYVRSAPRGQ